MNTNFFNQIQQLDFTGVLQLNISKGIESNLIVTVLLNNEQCGDSAKNLIPPLTFNATPQEFDEGFFEQITTPIQKVSGLMVDMEKFQKQLDEAKAQSAIEKAKTEKEKKRLRMKVHLTFTVVFFILIMVFKAMNDKSIVYLIMEIAGYTYGPLLGLFAFGIFTKFQISKKYSILTVTLLAPVLTYLINYLVTETTDYRIGVELIILNGLLTFIGLWLVKNKNYLKVV